ncbi:MAG: TonB-dependent receptor, partial [Bacteroidales bacterium]|nr:TonB-dependent receptor [Bacteroidales bacterium]
WNLRCGRRDGYSEMPDYNTLDITVGKDFPFKAGHSLAMRLIALNITDTRYELSSGYPMPGRSFYGSIEYKF